MLELSHRQELHLLLGKSARSAQPWSITGLPDMSRSATSCWCSQRAVWMAQTRARAALQEGVLRSAGAAWQATRCLHRVGDWRLPAPRQVPDQQQAPERCSNLDLFGVPPVVLERKAKNEPVAAARPIGAGCGTGGPVRDNAASAVRHVLVCRVKALAPRRVRDSATS